MDKKRKRREDEEESKPSTSKKFQSSHPPVAQDEQQLQDNRDVNTEDEMRDNMTKAEIAALIRRKLAPSLEENQRLRTELVTAKAQVKVLNKILGSRESMCVSPDGPDPSTSFLRRIPPAAQAMLYESYKWRGSPKYKGVIPVHIPEVKILENLLVMILERVLSFLDFRHLMAVRRVSRNWNAVAVANLKVLRKGTVTLEGTQFRAFYQLMERGNMELFPCRNFEVNIGTVRMEDGVPFFQKYGPFIKGLTICGRVERFNQGENCFPLLRLILLNVPNLVALNIRSLGTNIVNQSRIFGPGEGPTYSSLKSLEIHAPGISCVSRQQSGFFKSLFKRLPPALDSVKLCYVPLASITDLFSHKIQTLSVSGAVVVDQVRAADLAKVIEAQKGSIRSLSLESSTYQTEYKIEFPAMENLESLTIGHNLYPRNNQRTNGNLFKAIRSSACVPRLRNLVLPLWLLENIFQKDGQVFESVQTLHVNQGINGLANFRDGEQLELLARISTHFPNIKNLKLKPSLNGEELRLILRDFSSLERLDLQYNDEERNINNVLCGLPYSVDCQEFLGTRSEVVFKRSLRNLVRGINPPLPSLRDFKHLQSLKIRGHSWPLSETNTITDISGFMAFSKLDSLSNLVLVRTGKIHEHTLHPIVIGPEFTLSYYDFEF